MNCANGRILCLAIAASASLAAADPGLIAHWTLDGDAQDVSGNGHHGSVAAGAPTPCEDRFGNPSGAVCFDGDDGFIIPGGGLHPTTFTVSAWVRTTADGHRTILTSDPDNAGCNHGFALKLIDGRVSGSIDRSTGCGDGGGASGSSSFAGDGDWHHVAVIYKGEVAVFIDGQRDSAWVPIAYQPSFANLHIGFTPRSISGVRWWFSGAIDDIRYYDRALSAAEILRLARDCLPDFDGDGDVDATDFFQFLDLFAAGDLAADLNGDGVLDANDFFAFLDFFAAGCGG